jgi:hypothetical protein
MHGCVFVGPDFKIVAIHEGQTESSEIGRFWGMGDTEAAAPGVTASLGPWLDVQLGIIPMWDGLRVRNAPVNRSLRDDIHRAVGSARIGVVMGRKDTIKAVIKLVDLVPLEEVGMREMAPKKLHQAFVVAAPVNVAVAICLV